MNVKDLLKILRGVPEGSLPEEVSRSRTAFKICEAVLLERMGAPIGDEFTDVDLCYDGANHRYVLLGHQDDGVYTLAFTEPEKPYFIKFHEDGREELHRITLIPEHLLEALKMCKRFVDDRAKRLEDEIVRQYTSDHVYGTEDYLEKEYKSFVTSFMLNICKHTKSFKEARNQVPMKLNYKGRFEAYMQEHGANMENVHILSN